MLQDISTSDSTKKKYSSKNQQMKGGLSNPEVLRDILKIFYKIRRTPPTTKSSTTSTTTASTTINTSKRLIMIYVQVLR